MSFSLFASSDSTSLTLLRVVTVQGLTTQRKNIELRQPPYSESAFSVGDGARVIEPIRLGLLIQGVDDIDCENKFRQVQTFALKATTLRLDKDFATTFRALQTAPNGAHLERVEHTATNTVTADLVLLPRYVDWTTTLAETRVLYNAAIKRLY